MKITNGRGAMRRDPRLAGAFDRGLNMTVTLEKPIKATELDVLKQAAKAIRKHEKLKQDIREAEEAIRLLCRAFDAASGCSGMPPYKLRLACEIRGLL